MIGSSDLLLGENYASFIKAAENACKEYTDSQYIGKWEVPDFDLLNLVVNKIKGSGKYLSRTHAGPESLNILIYNSELKEKRDERSNQGYDKEVKVRCVWMKE